MRLEDLLSDEEREALIFVYTMPPLLAGGPGGAPEFSRAELPRAELPRAELPRAEVSRPFDSLLGSGPLLLPPAFGSFRRALVSLQSGVPLSCLPRLQRQSVHATASLGLGLAFALLGEAHAGALDAAHALAEILLPKAAGALTADALNADALTADALTADAPDSPALPPALRDEALWLEATRALEALAHATLELLEAAGLDAAEGGAVGEGLGVGLGGGLASPIGGAAAAARTARARESARAGLY